MYFSRFFIHKQGNYELMLTEIYPRLTQNYIHFLYWEIMSKIYQVGKQKLCVARVLNRLCCVDLALITLYTKHRVGVNGSTG